MYLQSANHEYEYIENVSIGVPLGDSSIISSVQQLTGPGQMNLGDNEDRGMEDCNTQESSKEGHTVDEGTSQEQIDAPGEQAPEVNRGQIFRNGSGAALVVSEYEQVRIFDTSQGTEVYEKVPNVNIQEILSAMGSGGDLYEQVPAVNVAQLLSQVITSRPGFSEYEQIGGYERVRYSKTMEQILRRISNDYRPYEHYERVRYSEEEERMFGVSRRDRECIKLNRGYERVQYSDAVRQLVQILYGRDCLSDYPEVTGVYERERYILTLEQMQPGYEQINGYERIQYSEAIEQMFNGSQPTTSDIYESVHYSEEIEQMFATLTTNQLP